MLFYFPDKSITLLLLKEIIYIYIELSHRRQIVGPKFVLGGLFVFVVSFSFSFPSSFPSLFFHSVDYPMF